MKKIKNLMLAMIVFCMFGVMNVKASSWARISSYDKVEQIAVDCGGCVSKVFYDDTGYNTHTIGVNSDYSFNDNYYYFASDFFVLDLKGKTLTNKNIENGEYKTLFEIGKDATLTIMDSVGGGKIEGGILVRENGTLIINGGIIGHSDLEGGAIVVNDGTVTINKGTLIGLDYGLSIDVANNKNIDLEINGGTFSGDTSGIGLKVLAPTNQTLSRNIEINGGTFSGIAGGMQVLNSSTLPKISSGNFASTGVNNYGGILIIKEDSIPFSPNSLLINGSKFSDDSFDEKTIGDNNYYASIKNVSIYKKHSIIISEITKGSVTASENLEYCDETITLTAVPNAGYRLKTVKIFNNNNVDITDLVKYNETSKTFTMPNYDVKVLAEFELIPVTTYTIKFDSIAVVSFDKTSPITVKSGDSEEIEIKADTGYRLKSVKVNDVEKLPLTNNKLSLTNIKENKIITVVVEKMEYEVIDGNNQKHTIGKESDAIFKIDADKLLFNKIYLNDEELNSIFYTITEGSTIITLKQDFLNRLLPGTYNLKVTFNDGKEAKAVFVIAESIEENPNTSFVIGEPIEENPNTNDPLILSIIIGSISLIGLLGTGLFIKKFN